MANTVVQNCQRGIIFVTFLLILFYFIITVISLIKKLLDNSDGEVQGQAGQSKYKEGQQKPQQNYDTSAEQFDHAAIDATKIKQDDPTIVKVIKKVQELEKSYFPLFIVIPLNILTGTSKAFSFVFFFFILLVVLLFNVGQIHRKCFDHKCMIVILENLWIGMMFFQLLNVWAATTILQPYIVVAG